MGVLQDLAKYPGSLYLVILLSAVGGFLFGYDTGVIAGALPLVEKEPGFFPEDPSRLDVVNVCHLWVFIDFTHVSSYTTFFRMPLFETKPYFQNKQMIGNQESPQPLWGQHSSSRLLEVLSQTSKIQPMLGNFGHAFVTGLAGSQPSLSRPWCSPGGPSPWGPPTTRRCS